MPSKTGSLLYEQFSKQQRRVLSAGGAEVILDNALNSFTGHSENLEFFQRALDKLKVKVELLAAGPLFISGYVRWANNPKRKSKRGYDTFVSNLINGFVDFLIGSGRSRIGLAEVDTALIAEFVGWVKTHEKGLSLTTGRKYITTIRAVLEELEKAENKDLLPKSKRMFPNGAFRDAEKFRKVTERLDDVTWQQLVRACKSEIREILAKWEPAWNFLDSGVFIGPDEEYDDRRRYRDIRAIWCWLRSQYGSSFVVPTNPELLLESNQLGSAIQYNHGMRAVERALYPSAYEAFVFALMHAILTLSNTGPLFGFQQDARHIVDVLEVPRVAFDIEKTRGNVTYRRSFALQEDDPLSPNRLHEVMARWTESIRPLAGQHAGHAFLFVTDKGKVRGFFTAKFDGKSSDAAWGHAASRFAKKHNLPPILVSVIRTTGLDIVRQLSGDDIRAVQAAGGQKAAATIERHYEGSAARKRREEALVHVMVTHERWAQRAGRPDTRGTADSVDNLAATPGWHCFDPFDSPMPGEQRGRLCRAFGGCPACPLAFVDLTSAYALARLIQLAEEIKRAKFYLTPQRWESAFSEGLHELREGWIPMFKRKDIRDSATRLELEPIGELE
ncbi:phage integrase SAM-like domain-containing protein [Burkholderia sp. Bp9143]|uniref:phage integrase SAM-like domain-containing protein n=1 Tax=Burkholderia sp. Bp9143 TaxID=2184574 RepID=UPI000F5A7D37|nr:phage integrase SAM-like domain-containing protein [Burkholderia sp. Bp9143]